MARMRFPSRPRPRNILAVMSTDDLRGEHPGDAAPAPVEPPTVTWSITTYPYADPAREEDTGDA